MKIKSIILGCSLILLAACGHKSELHKDIAAPKNVILLISDGTGLTQISSAFYFKEGSPNYQRFKQIGLIKTSSSREKVTDSAASGTAFASGVKTYNGAIGVADDSTEVATIVEIAANKGVKSGVIATSSITHATPASFYAHALSRGLAQDIALDLSESSIDFFAGGGIDYFNKREDGRNLLAELRDKQFLIDTTALGDYSSIQSRDKAGFLLAGDALAPIAKGRGNFLPAATDLAIQYLNQNENGFFIMAEGSQIDWGGHANDADYLVTELIDFDETIGKALDFAEKDGNTLVIVTSDHETGGFTLASKTKTRADGREYSDYSEIGMKFSTGGHSATLIPVFAYGPGAEEFAGIYENTEIFHKILKLTGWNK
jgi:alkaline phosphatase